MDKEKLNIFVGGASLLLLLGIVFSVNSYRSQAGNGSSAPSDIILSHTFSYPPSTNQASFNDTYTYQLPPKPPTNPSHSFFVLPEPEPEPREMRCSEYTNPASCTLNGCKAKYSEDGWCTPINVSILNNCLACNSTNIIKDRKSSCEKSYLCQWIPTPFFTACYE